MNPLYNIFTSNSQSASLRQYSKGTTIVLDKDIALVLEGVIATESVPGEELGSTEDEDTITKPVTLRLAGEGDFLNLELITSPSSWEHQNYVVESNIAVISTIRASDLRAVLDVGDSQERLELYSMIVKGLSAQLAGTTETMTYLSFSSSKNKVKWALERLEDISNKVLSPISRTRLVSYTGLNTTTVSKALSTLRKEGQLSDFGQKAVRARGMR